MQFVALIPLRGGSASLPRKNVRPLCGRPLCAWVIEACLDSGVFAEVWVSTDDDEIAEIAAECGARVHRRAPATATAEAPSEAALLEFAAAHPEAQVLALVQATSPLTDAADLRAAVARFEREGADSLVTVARRHGFRWSPEGQPLNYDPAARPRRQDWEGELVENGAFYFTRRDLLESSGCRLGGRIAVHEMAPETAYELDEPQDWEIVSRLLARRRASERAAALPERVDALVLDFDGVLTDDRVTVRQDGRESVVCKRGDGMGIASLRGAGVPLLVISTERNPVVRARCEKLGIPCEHGVEGKLAVLRHWLDEQGLDIARTVYVGNDVNDAECLSAVGCPVVVADAHADVRPLGRIVLAANGGHGAVREICDLILSRG